MFVALLLVFSLPGCGGSGNGTPPGSTGNPGSGGGSGGGGSAPTYNIGGSVAGLTGSGLQVVNNLTDQLTLDVAGSFSFAGQLEAGQAYNVQIVTQPSSPTNVCTIENPSGTIGAADVSDIEILCTGPLVITNVEPADTDENVSRAIAPTLSFSADIDPATALPENITLTSAAGDVSMTLNVNGGDVTLEPDNILFPLTDYSLNVSTDILGRDGERLLDPLGITFRTRDAVWKADREIDASIGTANDASIAFDTDGNALALWYQDSGTGTDIWWNLYTSGVGWIVADILEATTSGQSAGSPKVSFDPSGNAVAVWTLHDSASGTNSVRSSLYVAGNGWTALGSIEAVPDQQLGTVEFAANDSGDAVAAWVQFDGVNLDIWANRYTAGSGWGDAEVIDETDDIVATPRVAINDKGEILVVWAMRPAISLGTDVWARRYIPGGTWEESDLLSDQFSSADPRAILDNDGNAQVIWIEQRLVDDALMTSRYTAQDDWTEPYKVSLGGSITEPEIATDPAGNTIAVWRQQEDVNGTLELLPYAARQTGPNGWSTPDALGNRTAYYPKIAIDASGHALATWFELDLTLPFASAYSVWGNRFTNGSGWTSAEKIGSNGVLIGTGMPRLAVDSSGDAFTIWTRAGEVRVNRFE